MPYHKLKQHSKATTMPFNCFGYFGGLRKKSSKRGRKSEKSKDERIAELELQLNQLKQAQQERNAMRVSSFRIHVEEMEVDYENYSPKEIVFPLTINNKQDLKKAYDDVFNNQIEDKKELNCDVQLAQSSQDSYFHSSLNSNQALAVEPDPRLGSIPTTLPQITNQLQIHDVHKPQSNNKVEYQQQKLQKPLQLKQQEFQKPLQQKQDLQLEESRPFEPLPQQQVNIRAVRETGRTLNMFALSLNKILYNDGNCVFSPFSIFNALGLVLEATQANTHKQILQTLNLNITEVQEIRQNYRNFISNVLSTQKKSFKLFSANRFYANSDVKISSKYKSTLQKFYNADSISAEFSINAEKERQNINDWVSMVTGNQILDLMPVGSVSVASVAVLVNALYFEGSWDEVFDPANNEMRDFKTKEGEVKKVETMVLKQLCFRALTEFDIETDIKCISLKMPYDNGAASFHVVLPMYDQEDNNNMDIDSSSPKKNGIERLLQDLDQENLEYILKYGEEQYVDIFLPKFSVEFATTMSEPLKRLGMTDAFDPLKADFGGMLDKHATTQNIFITEGFHKTKITVNETGTVAASAVAFGLTRGTPPKPLQFEVNRPFLFMVVHESSKTILFSGVIDDPTLNG